MASKSVSAKLGIKAGYSILIVNAPDRYEETLGELPEGVSVESTAEGPFDMIQTFVRDKADVDDLAAGAIDALKPGGLLWFAYPKKSSKVKTDISRDSGWESLAREGLRPVTQVSIDDTWSALRFRSVSEVRTRSKALTEDDVELRER